jgi:hypothetical protein
MAARSAQEKAGSRRLFPVRARYGYIPRIHLTSVTFSAGDALDFG